MKVIKTLKKDTRQLFISYPLEDFELDYEIIKEIVRICREKSIPCYFTINSTWQIRTFVISADKDEKFNILQVMYDKIGG